MGKSTINDHFHVSLPEGIACRGSSLMGNIMDGSNYRRATYQVNPTNISVANMKPATSSYKS